MNAYLNGGGNEFSGVEQYETLISALPGGIVVTAADEAFTILFANPGYYAMVGYEQAEHMDKFGNIGTATLHPNEAANATQSAREQMQKTGTFSVKTKLSHKEKEYIWAHFNGRLCTSPDGNPQIYMVIVDVSEHMVTLEKLERERSFSELMGALSEEAFFECDLLAGTVRYSKNFADKLDVDEVSTDYREALLQLGILKAEHLLGGESHFEDLLDERIEREVRLTLPNGDDVWYLCRCDVQKNAQGNCVKMIGKLLDITRHKMQIDELSELAQKDQLTGLYNKTATESLIKETLKMRRQHDDSYALLIIDIDNFKNVNDRLGHLYGDAVLTQLAENLKSLFRSDDVVGRVGGDEFFVFLKNCDLKELLREKAQAVCTTFHKTYSKDDTFVTISASIGIALCPEHGVDFDGLYKKADVALYDAKAKGKNAVSFYVPDLNQAYTSTRTEIDASILQKSFKDNRIEYVFRLLYDSENPVSSIQSVLQLVTESFGFSRGYIFETSADGCFTSNTFEWCAKEIRPEITNLQDVAIAAVQSANQSFNKTGMFILKNVRELPKIEREVLEPQGILSMFQFGIKDMGKLMGFIGFDDCLTEHIPTDTEIDEICTVCHVLSTFLLKHRRQEHDERHHEALETVMDNLNSYAYVIDRSNYKVLYENQNVIALTGNCSIGKACYLAYRGKQAPCSNCPMMQMDEEIGRHTMELYNEKFDFYVRAEATNIDWADNRKACLICSVDISEYKQKKL